MSKPIEVGCRAEIINSIHPERNGTIVTVFFYGFEHEGKPTWIIDQDFPNEDGKMSDRVYEYMLRRIDDDDLNKELCVGWEDMEDLFIPDALKVKS